jgi:hypothetical protein
MQQVSSSISSCSIPAQASSLLPLLENDSPAKYKNNCQDLCNSFLSW